MTTLALWNMNETSGTTLVDSSGHGINGTIGSEVVKNGSVHTFNFLKPNTPPAHPGHIDTVTSSQLNPGTRDYSITIRLKWTNSFGNIIQKGQSGTTGGYFKWQAPGGKVQCLFRGSSGNAGVGSPTTLNNGQWHVINCTRTATQVTMTVDGVLVATLKHATGTISNTKVLSIAGKSTCDQITVTCDYWVGQIDYVQIQTS
ncbi:MAG: LamG-like jellyroll fold domain-containing protein [Actinomycetes bacterium]